MLTRRILAACLFILFVTLSACNQTPGVKTPTPEPVDVTVAATLVTGPETTADAPTLPPMAEGTVAATVASPTAVATINNAAQPVAPVAIEPGPTLPAGAATPR